MGPVTGWEPREAGWLSLGDTGSAPASRAPGLTRQPTRRHPPASACAPARPSSTCGSKAPSIQTALALASTRATTKTTTMTTATVTTMMVTVTTMTATGLTECPAPDDGRG